MQNFVCDPLDSADSTQIKKVDNSKPYARENKDQINLLKPTGHVMHQQFNIQQLYALPHAVFMCFVFI